MLQMNRVFLLVAVLSFVQYSCGQKSLPKGVKMIEKVARNPKDMLQVPYDKYKLDNGLTVIIHEDHSDPVVYVDVTYHVGSSRELPGRSGFAHFFEHMMFQGSKNVADEEHFKLVTSAGGTLNGTTSEDRTNYYQTVPSNQVEKMLWLEADRMGFLLNSVTQEKFEVQRSTVKNERGQRMDNQPYGLISEKMGQAMYPFGHQYSWSVIGYMDDLDAATLQDLKQFFMRWYGPNNATLTLSGDVDVEKTLSWVSKYFGSISKGATVENQAVSVPKLDKDRYISYEDKVPFPALLISYPSVPRGHKDEPALDALAEILAGGKSSILYRKLVKLNKAPQVEVTNGCKELSGEFTFFSLAYPGVKLVDLQKEFYGALDWFEKEGVSDSDLAKFKAGFATQFVEGLSTVTSKGLQLAYGEVFFDDPNIDAKFAKRYAGVTKEQVMSAYDKYIKDKPAVHLSVYPKGGEDMVVKPDNFTPRIATSEDVKASDMEQYKNLTPKEPKDSFDRSKAPMAGKNPQVKLPKVDFGTMKGGIRYAYTRWNETPTVDINIEIPVFSRGIETVETAGLFSFMCTMMGQSTENYTSEAMSDALQTLGSQVYVYSDQRREYITVRVSSLKKNIAKTLELVEEILFHPAFKEEDFQKVKNQTAAGIKYQNKQARGIARGAYGSMLYGNHIMAISKDGSLASVSAMTLERIKETYKKYFSTSGSLISIVSNVDKKELLPHLAFMENETIGKTPTPPSDIVPKYPSETTICFVDKPGAVQSVIVLGALSMKYDALGDYYKSKLMNYTLGGAFNSRLNLRLREEKGYTYGARSGFSGTKYIGSFTAQAAVKATATKDAVQDFVNIIGTYASKGISPQEIEFMKQSIGQSKARKYESPYQKTRLISSILAYDLDPSYLDNQAEILRTISKQEINGLASKYIDLNKMVIVVVGDKEKYLKPLKSLGYKTKVIKRGKDGIYR